MILNKPSESSFTKHIVLEPSPGVLLRRRMFRHMGFIFGASILVFIILMAILAPVLAPHNPYDQNMNRRLINPIWHPHGTWKHPLGTDGFGRDYMTRIMYGAQISLLIGFSAMVISGIIGTAMGVAAGYFGGRIDMMISFMITTRLSLPLMLVALAIVSIIGNSLQIVICAIGLLIWDRFAVVMRTSTQQVRNMDYVATARTVGCSTLRILLTEVLPNVMNNLIVVATLEVAHAILMEAGLSFLGFGVQPPLPSWGLMISEGKGYMFFSPWLVWLPGGALFALILAVNLLGDGIRDITAPENIK